MNTAINVVIFDATSKEVVHDGKTLRVPPEVIMQAEDGDVPGIVTQWARKLGMLKRDESVWTIPQAAAA